MNKKLFVILILIAVVVISGASVFIAQSASGGEMAVVEKGGASKDTSNLQLTAEKGDHVSVDYLGTLEDGTQFDSSEGREPLEFDIGAGQMIKGFDNGVVGMKINETKSVKIDAKDAYGESDPRLLVEVNLSDLAKNNITPEVGMKLYSQGQQAIVTKVTNKIAIIDFNHPLAGKTLIFKIKMLEIKKK